MSSFHHKNKQTYIWGLVGGIFAGTLALQWIQGQYPWLLSVVLLIALIATYYEVRKIDEENVEYDDELTYKYLDLLDDHVVSQLHRKMAAPKVAKVAKETTVLNSLEAQFQTKPRLKD